MIMKRAYDTASLSNPKPELLDPANIAGRNNALDTIISSAISRKPNFEITSVKTECNIHGTQSWIVTQSVAEAGNVQCQKCQWEQDACQNNLQDMKSSLLASLEIPREHINASFDNWSVMGDNELRARLDRIISFAKQYAIDYKKGAPNLLLTGNTGTGKTKLASLIANDIVRHRYHARMTVAFKRSSQIQKEVKATWDKNASDDEVAYLERLGRATVLIVDEVGEADTGFTDKYTDKAREQLSAIIDRRYQLRLPTIITTNMTADEFYHYMGDRASDRLNQNMVNIPCVWPSYRMLTGSVRTLV